MRRSDLGIRRFENRWCVCPETAHRPSSSALFFSSTTTTTTTTSKSRLPTLRRRKLKRCDTMISSITRRRRRRKTEFSCEAGHSSAIRKELSKSKCARRLTSIAVAAPQFPRWTGPQGWCNTRVGIAKLRFARDDGVAVAAHQGFHHCGATTGDGRRRQECNRHRHRQLQQERASPTEKVPPICCAHHTSHVAVDGSMAECRSCPISYDDSRSELIRSWIFFCWPCLPRQGYCV